MNGERKSKNQVRGFVMSKDRTQAPRKAPSLTPTDKHKVGSTQKKEKG